MAVLYSNGDEALVATDTRAFWLPRLAGRTVRLAYDDGGRLIATRAGGWAAALGGWHPAVAGLAFLRDEAPADPHEALAALVAYLPTRPDVAGVTRDVPDHPGAFHVIGAGAAGTWGGWCRENTEPVVGRRIASVIPPTGLPDRGEQLMDELEAVLDPNAPLSLFERIRAVARYFADTAERTDAISSTVQVGLVVRERGRFVRRFIEAEAAELAGASDEAIRRMATTETPMRLSEPLRAGAAIRPGALVCIEADEDTRSWRVERVDGGGTWIMEGDGRDFLVDITQDDPEKNKGIEPGEVASTRVLVWESLD